MSDATSIPPPPEDVVEALASALLATSKSSIALPELLSTWDAVDPGWATTTGGRLRLADALRRLDAERVIELPSPRGSRWDAALPRLPTKLAVPANRQPRVSALDPAHELWVPALAWAPGWIRATRPPQRLRAALVAVNRWLAAMTGRVPPTISREERSLEVFGDEKTLAALLGTVLCAPGRISLDLLVCEAPIGGVRLARFADTGPVLVVENKAMFDSAWRALRQHAGSTMYAALVFGGGDHAPSLVPELAQLDQIIGVQPTAFHYAGDIDIAGLSAAEAFVRAGAATGIATMPAHHLWNALAAAKPAGPDLTGDADERKLAIAAAEHLGLSPLVVKHLEQGVRVPQERIDRTALADTSWWRP